MNNKLINAIANFHEWANREGFINGTPKEYHESENEYPNGEIFNSAICELLIDTKDLTTYSIDLIIQSMAIFNESEMVLELLIEKLPETILDKFLARAVDSNYWEAKWQIAELVTARRGIKGIDFLMMLISDSNDYVVRRALLCLARIDKIVANEVALSLSNSTNEYIRAVSYWIIKQVSPEENELKLSAIYSSLSDILKEGVLKWQPIA